ncbi:MAG: ribosome recycling factor [Anaerolineales bacterium]
MTVKTIQKLMHETEQRMGKAVEAMETDFKGIRTGRASPALIERVMVPYYGSPTPLNQLAVISAPEPHLLVVRPYDPSSLGDIEKAILQADLGLNPGNDGRVIRVPIPRLTEERRRELVKLVNRRMEECKISLRNIRRDTLEQLREYENDKVISEDELIRGKERLQEVIDEFTQKVEDIGARKEKDIMEI